MATQVSVFIKDVEITLNAEILDDNGDIVTFETGENKIDDPHVVVGIGAHSAKKFAALLAEQYSYAWDIFETGEKSVVVFYGKFYTEENSPNSFEYWHSNDELFDLLDWVSPEEVTIIQG